VRIALRLGAYELIHHHKVPAHAAVNEAVEVAKELRAGRATGFVNAVLRRLSETRGPASAALARGGPGRTRGRAHRSSAVE